MEERDYYGSDPEEEEEQEDPEELGKALIKASGKGILEEVESLIKRKADVNYIDKKGWTPLTWASSQGHYDIVKLLTDKGAENVTPSNSEIKISATPLHWAAFNGQVKCVWLLIKRGFDPNSLDLFGNNCVHSAAAGGRKEVLETFLGYGVDVELKNTRGHTPLNLAENEEVKSMLKAALKTEKCYKCSSGFNIRNPRCLCHVCYKYYCKNCIEGDWLYLEPGSLEEERYTTRCFDCKKYIDDSQSTVSESIESNVCEKLEESLDYIEKNKVDIDIKLLKRAQEHRTRLQAEREVKNFLSTVEHVENYKTIQKSCFLIKTMLEDALANGISLDSRVIEKAEQERERLLAERNLRHETSTKTVADASDEEVSVLESLIQQAEDNKVAPEYIESAKELSQKMQENINAHYILRLFLDYPMREYPEPEPVDPKKRNQPQQKALPPKKKKKEPKLVIPDWASEIKGLIAQVESLEKLIKKANDIELNTDFLDQAKENLTRMRKEIKFRQDEEEEARIAAEKRAAAKKAKK